MNRTVRVDLGKRSYDILIARELVGRAGALIAALRPGARCAIVTDANVEARHGESLRASLAAAGIEHVTIEVPSGEGSKSWQGLQQVVAGILDARLERNDLVVAFGGGVVGDLAGFAASIVRRGMDFVQIPTSLLAQVDSSVGGKTGINAAQGKNLIGAFHQPVLVLADTDVLRTLPEREFRAGYAEIAKYGLIDRPEFFAWLEENRDGIFAFGPALAVAIGGAGGPLGEKPSASGGQLKGGPTGISPTGSANAPTPTGGAGGGPRGGGLGGRMQVGPRRPARRPQVAGLSGLVRPVLLGGAGGFPARTSAR